MNWFRTIQADINGFWPLFWTAYVETMLIGLGDLIFLDYLLLKRTGSRLHADGAKNDPFYEPGDPLTGKGLSCDSHQYRWL